MQTISFECKKDKLNQLQDGTWKLTLTIHPEDITMLANASMGQQFMCVLAPVNGGEPAQIEAKPVKESRDWKDLKYVEQAGILCGQPEFLEFITLRFPDFHVTFKGSDNEACAELIRAKCNIKSRKELDTNIIAQGAFRSILKQYLQWKEQQ